MKLIKNKTIIFVLLFLAIMISLSFYQIYKESFSYSKSYYEIKNDCYHKKNTKNKICDNYRDREYLEFYIKTFSPKKTYSELDAITLTCRVVETTVFSVLQFISPLLVIICVVGLIHSEISSGMFKNYLLREEYGKYLKKLFLNILYVSLVIPLTLSIIFIVSCFITKFNFNISDNVKIISVYNTWKYNHFLFYGLAICFIQFVMSYCYGCIGLYSSFKNKNSIISVVVGYVYFIVFDLFVYIILYAGIINKLLGFKNMTDYFNITGYWFFNDGKSCIPVCIISLILLIVLIIFTYYKISNKEEVLLDNERKEN